MFVAIDANFRLCRRAKAGHTCANSPLIQPTLFLPQDEVDRYVKSEQRRPSYITEVCLLYTGVYTLLSFALNTI